MQQGNRSCRIRRQLGKGHGTANSGRQGDSEEDEEPDRRAVSDPRQTLVGEVSNRAGKDERARGRENTAGPNEGGERGSEEEYDEILN